MMQGANSQCNRVLAHSGSGEPPWMVPPAVALPLRNYPRSFTRLGHARAIARADGWNNFQTRSGPALYLLGSVPILCIDLCLLLSNDIRFPRCFQLCLELG